MSQSIEKNRILLIAEIKLSINNRLFEKGYITEEMFRCAKEIIIKHAA